MQISLDDKIFSEIGDTADGLSVPAYVVGGYVRDKIIFDQQADRDKKTYVHKDIDIVTVGDGPAFAQAVAQRLGVRDVHIFRNFGTAMLRHEDRQIEFVGARKESYRPDSRKPEVMEGTLEDDLARRDFTINTIAVSLNRATRGAVQDPFGGIADILEKIIRTPKDPDITYADDPLRMLRAARFSSKLGFRIEKLSFLALCKNAPRIKIISMERISEELNKMLLAPVPSVGFKALFEAGLLHLIFPEMTALAGVDRREGKMHKDNFFHTLQVLDNLVKRQEAERPGAGEDEKLWLRWAAVLHDIAKPATKRFDTTVGWTLHGHEDVGARMVPKIFARLKLPQDEKMRFVQKLVQLHLRPIALVDDIVTDSACRRLLMEAGEDID